MPTYLPSQFIPLANIKKRSQHDIAIKTFGDGYRLRAGQSINNAIQEIWDFTFSGLEEEDADTLENFLENLRGVDTLRYRPPTGRYEISGRFGQCDRQMISGAHLYSVSFQLTKEFEYVITDFIPVNGVSESPQNLFNTFQPSTSSADFSFYVDVSSNFYLTQLDTSTAIDSGSPSTNPDPVFPVNTLRVYIGFLTPSAIEISDRFTGEILYSSAWQLNESIAMHKLEVCDRAFRSIRVRILNRVSVDNDRRFTDFVFRGRLLDV